MDGEHLEQRFRDGGFVDIQVIRRDIDIGDWRGGSTVRYKFNTV